MGPHRAMAHGLSVSGPAPRPRTRHRGGNGYGATFISFFLSCFSIYGNNGKLQCPPVVVAVRKLVANTPICRAIRPQPLSNRLAACFALALAGNVPPGMLKEHFDKFSPQWILAVHASVPVVAALRKATRLPPYAILVTVLGSVLGQMVGGRMERHQMELDHSYAVASYPSSTISNNALPQLGMISPQMLTPWALCAAAAMWKHVSNPWEETSTS
jgi:hypothetical protein